jgi:hypothetical protein
MHSISTHSGIATDEVTFAEVLDEAEVQQDSTQTANPASFVGLVELLLKGQKRLDVVARSPATQRELIPRLLAVSLIGYAVFGIAVATMFSAAKVWPELTPIATWLETPTNALIQFARPSDQGIWSHWLDGSALALTAAFALGLIGANGICLPSFYFYGLLAGVKTNMLHVTTNALKGMASGAVAVVGALPIYFAAVLGLIVFHAPQWTVNLACLFGLTLPFIAGLWGTRAVYLGLLGMTDTLPEERRSRRTVFLRRLLFAWCACYTAVAPVVIYTLWDLFSR